MHEERGFAGVQLFNLPQVPVYFSGRDFLGFGGGVAVFVHRIQLVPLGLTFPKLQTRT